MGAIQQALASYNAGSTSLYTAWDPPSKGSTAILSNANLTCQSGPGAVFGARSTKKGIVVGSRVYFEVRVDAIGGSPCIGIDDGSTTTANIGFGSSTGYGLTGANGWFQSIHSGSPVDLVAPASLITYAVNDIIGIAVDLISVTPTIAYYRGGSIIGTAQGILSKDYYAATGSSNTNRVTANFSTSTSFTPPAGFTAGILA